MSFMMLSCAHTYQSVAPSYYIEEAVEQERPDRTVITLIRPGSIATVIGFNIYCDDEYVGSLGPRGYLSWTVDTGRVFVLAKGENKERRVVSARAGEEVFLRLRVEPGLLSPRVRLEEVSAEMAAKFLQKSRPARMRVDVLLEQEEKRRQ